MSNSFNTTQNVKIGFKTAKLTDRILAFLIDFVIQLVFVFFASFTFLSDYRVEMIMLMMIPLMLYSLILESCFGGYTVGKKIMGIRVVDLSGARVSFLQCLTRYVFRLIDISISQGAVAIFFIATKKNGQRLGDIMAKTIVISTRIETIQHSQNRGIYIEVPEDYIPKYPQIKLATDNDMKLIKQSINQLNSMEDRISVLNFGNKVRNMLMEKYGIPVDKTIDPLTFLNSLLMDYNYYFLK